MTRTLETVIDENGDTIVLLPDDLIQSLGWVLGDTVTWNVRDDGSVSLTKLDMSTKKINFKNMSVEDLRQIIRFNHPRIDEQIELRWGTPDMTAKFVELLVDARGGRQGFSPDVMAALNVLDDIHRETFNFQEKKTWVGDLQNSQLLYTDWL
jgi:hypothetical protein